MQYDRPIYRITLDGQDLSAGLAPRLMSLSLQEHRGEEADQLDIELSDADGLLAVPTPGAVLTLALGWAGEPLVDKGTYKVDEAGHRGAPDVISLRARSADLTGALRKRTERSFHDTTLGEIIRSIAGANSLEAVVGDTLDHEPVEHIDQTNESDLNFLTRLGKRYDAVATVKEGRLLFLLAHGGKTAGGADMPRHIIYRRDGDNHDYNHSTRDAYTGVQASWQDPRGGKKREAIAGTDENPKKLRDTYASERDALAAAQSEWQRIQRGYATMKFAMARAMPQLSPQQKVEFADMKPPMGGVDWLIKTATHSLSESGFTTVLDLELTDMPDDSHAGGD